MQTNELQHALIRLFAIVVAGSEANLTQQSELLFAAYLNDYVPLRNQDSARKLFYQLIEDHNSDKGLKKVSLSSSKILRICMQVNTQSTYNQKMELLMHLVAFVYSLLHYDQWSSVFLDSVADSLGVSNELYLDIRNFAAANFNVLPVSSWSNPVSDIYVYNAHDEFMFMQSVTSDFFLNGRLVKSMQMCWVSRGAIVEADNRQISWQQLKKDFYINNKPSKVLEVQGVDYAIHDKQILYPTYFSLESGTTMAVVGASGAGKSTLLKLICGLLPSKNPAYLMDESSSEIPINAAYVPQDDALISEFTIKQMIHDRYRLLCACNVPVANHDLNSVLQMVGLVDYQNQKIGVPNQSDLSGGQRKRLSIAIELLSDVSLLCLDEPTSGLASGDANMLVDVLRSVAAEGKIVIASVHQPSFELITRFDKLLILDKGGFPVYFGAPSKASHYLRKIANVADNTALNCRACGSYRPEDLFKIIEATKNGIRSILPETWYQHYLSTLKMVQDNTNRCTRKIHVDSGSFCRRVLAYMRRDYTRLVSKPWSLFVQILLPAVLALLIGFISRAGADNYTFIDNPNVPAALLMIVVAALFSGMVSTGTFINGDAGFHFRDVIVDRKQGAYFTAKLFQSFVGSVVAAFIYTAIFVYSLGFLGMFLSYFLVLWLTVWFGSIVGLVLSKWFKSVAMVYLLIPAIIIPQLMFSGLVIDYDNLPQIVKNKQYTPIVADLCVARWAFEAMAVTQYATNDYEFYFFPTHVDLSETNYYLYYFLPALSEIAQKDMDYAATVLANEKKKHASFPAIDADVMQQIRFLKQVYSNKRSMLTEEEDLIRTQLAKVYDLNDFAEKYTNKSLRVLVCSLNKQVQILDTHEGLERKYMPIYYIPHHPLGRAQMFAPMKRIGRYLMPTKYFNSMIILIMNFLLGLLLFLKTQRRFS